MKRSYTRQLTSTFLLPLLLALSTKGVAQTSSLVTPASGSLFSSVLVNNQSFYSEDVVYFNNGGQLMAVEGNVSQPGIVVRPANVSGTVNASNQSGFVFHNAPVATLAGNDIELTFNGTSYDLAVGCPGQGSSPSSVGVHGELTIAPPTATNFFTAGQSISAASFPTSWNFNASTSTNTPKARIGTQIKHFSQPTGPMGTPEYFLAVSAPNATRISTSTPSGCEGVSNSYQYLCENTADDRGAVFILKWDDHDNNSQTPNIWTPWQIFWNPGDQWGPSGSNGVDGFGESLAVLDVDGDTLLDVVVGAPKGEFKFTTAGDFDSGLAFVIQGAGTPLAPILWTLDTGPMHVASPHPLRDFEFGFALDVYNGTHGKYLAISEPGRGIQLPATGQPRTGPCDNNAAILQANQQGGAWMFDLTTWAYNPTSSQPHPQPPLLNQFEPHCPPCPPSVPSCGNPMPPLPNANKQAVVGPSIANSRMGSSIRFKDNGTELALLVSGTQAGAPLNPGIGIITSFRQIPKTTGYFGGLEFISNPAAYTLPNNFGVPVTIGDKIFALPDLTGDSYPEFGYTIRGASAHGVNTIVGSGPNIPNSFGPMFPIGNNNTCWFSGAAIPPSLPGSDITISSITPTFVPSVGQRFDVNISCTPAPGQTVNPCLPPAPSTQNPNPTPALAVLMVGNQMPPINYQGCLIHSGLTYHGFQSAIPNVWAQFMIDANGLPTATYTFDIVDPIPAVFQGSEWVIQMAIFTTHGQVVAPNPNPIGGAVALTRPYRFGVN